MGDAAQEEALQGDVDHCLRDTDVLLEIAD